MADFKKLRPFDGKGRVQMVVETPAGASIKFKYDDELDVFTVSRSLALGLAYPFDWGFIPGTLAEDGDAVDAICLHDHTSYPGVVLPCRAVALVKVSQMSKRGRVGNPRVILAPAWQGGSKLGIDLSGEARAEIEAFFLNATLFTGKDATIDGWGDAADAEAYVRNSVVG